VCRAGNDGSLVGASARKSARQAGRARGAFEVAGVATVVLANIGIYVFGLVMLIRAIWS
jgi:hypothetical protein